MRRHETIAMTPPDLDAFHLTASLAFGALAVVNATLGISVVRYGMRYLDAKSLVFVPILACAGTVYWASFAVMSLPPVALWYDPPAWAVGTFWLSEWTSLLVNGVGRHYVHALERRTATPSRAWLIVNYGVPALTAVLTVTFPW